MLRGDMPEVLDHSHVQILHFAAATVEISVSVPTLCTRCGSDFRRWVRYRFLLACASHSSLDITIRSNLN